MRVGDVKRFYNLLSGRNDQVRLINNQGGLCQRWRNDNSTLHRNHMYVLLGLLEQLLGLHG